jgi:hypothetical protein
MRPQRSKETKQDAKKKGFLSNGMAMNESAPAPIRVSSFYSRQTNSSLRLPLHLGFFAVAF